MQCVVLCCVAPSRLNFVIVISSAGGAGEEQREAHRPQIWRWICIHVLQLESLGKLTGLNAKDVNVAVTSPRRIAYIEETLRDMEQGNLKIRVRSLENEKSLDRISLQQVWVQVGAQQGERRALAGRQVSHGKLEVPGLVSQMLCICQP